MGIVSGSGKIDMAKTIGQRNRKAVRGRRVSLEEGCPRRDWLLAKWKSRSGGVELYESHPLMRWLDNGKSERDFNRRMRAVEAGISR